MGGIDRRDFLNGVALTLVAGGTLSPADLFAEISKAGGKYPPSLTGMRGSHPGSFEVAHALAWEGQKFGRAEKQVDDPYDLIVVGGGLSGLAAARFAQKKLGEKARILILDNHDDFGGHAKRNEFFVDGSHIIGYGGSQSIDSPADYSPEARELLSDIGINVERFYEYFDRDFYSDRDMSAKIFFDEDHYGENVLTTAPFGFFGGAGLMRQGPGDDDELIAGMPISDESKAALSRFLKSKQDYLPGLSDDEKWEVLERTPYTQYLREYCALPEELITLIDRAVAAPYLAMPWSASAAYEAADILMPGIAGLGLEGSGAWRTLLSVRKVMPHGLWRAMVKKLSELSGEEPYIYHFPDGNAGIARLLVRKLRPDVAPGSTMEDVVTAPFDYDALDAELANVRIRLSSTVVDVRHADGGSAVDVSYVSKGEFRRVVGQHAILACNHKIIPHICAELPSDQAEALNQADRVPLVYINVALRNWHAFHKAGAELIYSPQAHFSNMSLDFPVSIGEVAFSGGPDQPIVLHIVYAPSAYVDTAGKTVREIYDEGRQILYAMSFAEFEMKIKDQLNAMLRPHGFDANRDIAAITVNRWPHGYAYETTTLTGDPDPTDPSSPNVTARARLGRISIANSDAEYRAYADAAIDAAHRAVAEQFGA